MDGINIDIRPESEFIEPETSGIIQVSKQTAQSFYVLLAVGYRCSLS